MTIQEIYRKIINQLKKDFILNPNPEARILIMHVLKINEKEFIINKDNTVIGFINKIKLNFLVRRRLTGESIGSIIRKKHFYDLDYYVNKDVLIPRPETEMIIDIVLEKFDRNTNLSIFDIGTGCGNIAVTLADKLNNCKIDAMDISKKALKIARVNIKKNNINKGKINLICGNFFKYSTDKIYDIIISNPPYIKSGTVTELFYNKIVSDPRIALDGGVDGLDFYRRLSGFSKTNLKNGGCLVLEHGFNQREKILKIFNEQCYECSVYNDLAGVNRVIVINKKG